MANFIATKMDVAGHRIKSEVEISKMTVKKNICITINSLAPGGAEKQSLLLAKALKPYHNTTVVIINPQPIYKKHIAVIEKDDIKHIFLDRNPIKKN